jgi:hypothetical protein
MAIIDADTQLVRQFSHCRSAAVLLLDGQARGVDFFRPTVQPSRRPAKGTEIVDNRSVNANLSVTAYLAAASIKPITPALCTSSGSIQGGNLAVSRFATSLTTGRCSVINESRVQ